MLKELEIDCYENFYRVDSVNCIDQPIAGALGYFNYYNYFYYCFYLSVLNNWDVLKTDMEYNFVNYRNIIIEKMGLLLKDIYVENPSDFVPLVKEKIDKGEPILLVPKRCALVYNSSYGDVNDKNYHGTLITGYKKGAPMLILRDVAHIESSEVKNAGTGYGLFKLFLKEDIVHEMWEESNNIYREEKSYDLLNKIFYITKVGEPEISSFESLVTDFVNSYSSCPNILATQIMNLSETYEEFGYIDFVEYFRKSFYNNITVIFDVLERAFRAMNFKEEDLKSFFEFRDKFVKYRYILVSKLYAEFLRKNKLSNDMKLKIVSEVNSMDNELFTLIKNLLEKNQDISISSSSWSDKRLVKYSTVTADSEFDFGPASGALDGDEKTWWHSDSSSPIHWLNVDLGEIKTVNKFCVKHVKNPNFVTKDFKIQGSHDGHEWIDLVTVNGNCSYETVHDITPVSFRFFRLYITYPCINDFAARIFEFEIWES